MTREEAIVPELNLKYIIAESRDVAKALNKFADELEQIEKKYKDRLRVERGDADAQSNNNGFGR